VTLEVANPATGAVVARLPADDAASVAAKSQRARQGARRWAATPLTERIEALRRFRSLAQSQSEALARILTTEVGKPLAQSRNELKGLLARLDFFIAEAPSVLAEEAVHSEPDGALEERISREPLGVVANVSAWNYPWFVGSNVFVPALLAGNAVLYKPSEHASLTGLEIARLFAESGVPEDAFVPVIGAGETGGALVAQPVDGIFFTGSVATGRRIAQAAAGRMVKLQLELGGKDPVYVCENVDIARAAASVADGAFYNTGQSCCSVERIYVHASIFERFVEAFVAEVRGYRIGDPMDESTYIGPLARAAQIEVLQRQVDDALAKGARLLAGGRRLARPGNWFEPTVLVDVDHSMAVMREESFGPVIGLMPAADDGQAIELMNDTPYGLTAGVFTAERERARRILARVNAGSVYWNCCDRVSPRLPWSGVGDSGIGLTLSRAGIEAFTRPKAWHLRDRC
jgi:acyl-CoA reductase-like NAD-dependent aldehyde dehydrogenase